MKTSRRAFIARSVATATALSAGINSFANSKAFDDLADPVDAANFSINIFSKNLHWLNYDDMAAAVASIGFEGVDLTVRPKGHVEPERVAQDLPRAAAAIHKAGLKLCMITTAITSATDPMTEPILKAASALKIGCYRTGWLEYDEKISLEENLKVIGKNLSALADLNKKYNIKGHYQNHTGAGFGAPMWDLATVLREINSPWLGSQYDVLHATVEGANSWPLGFQLASPYVGSMDIKDFKWSQKDGKWRSETVPLGEGMVDFKKYFSLIKKYKVKGPFSIHFEYPLGGAENGAKEISLSKEVVLAAMKKDAATLKKWLLEEGIRTA